MKPSVALRAFLAGSSLLISPALHAANGTWDTDVDGNWSEPTNWQGDTVGDIADGVDGTATLGDFITANRIINLDTARTLGNITAADTSHNYTISGSNILTLDTTTGTSPIVDVVAGNRTLTIDSVIDGTDGLIKNGAGTLDLSITEAPHANTYSGGTTINAGIIRDVGAGSLGTGTITFAGNSAIWVARVTDQTLTNAVQIDPGVIGTVNAINQFYRFATSGALTGSGTLNVTSSDNGRGRVEFNSTANTFTGQVNLATNSSGNDGWLKLGSLGDGGAIQFGAGSRGGRLIFEGTVADQNFTTRQVVLNTTTGESALWNDGTNAVTMTQDLAITANGNKTFALGGSSTAANEFGGNIADGASSVISLKKSGDGNWSISGDLSHTGQTIFDTQSGGTAGRLMLSGTNTNSGGYLIQNNGEVVFQGSQSFATGSVVNMVHGGGVTNSSTVRFLDDAVGTVDFDGTLQFNTSNAVGSQGIFVGNNSTGNFGTSTTSSTTGSTIRVSNAEFTTIASNINASGTITQVSSANEYRLQINNVTLNNLSTRAVDTETRMGFSANSTNVTLGNIAQANGNANGAIALLSLQGNSTGNQVTGVISDAADFTDTTNANARALTVQVVGTSTWEFSGDSTYTGGTTVGSSSTLQIGDSGTLGSGSYSGAISNAGSFVYSSSSAQTLGGVISGSGSLTKDTSSTSVLTLTGDNSYNGTTTVSAGSLIINGNNSGTGAVSVASGAALGGNGTVGGDTTFSDNSIFAWGLSVHTPSSTTSTNTGDTFAVTGTGALNDGGTTGSSVFKILLDGSQTFGDAFWNASHSWTDVLTSGNGLDLATLFTSFSYANDSGSISAPSSGSFTLSGSTLSYDFTAVPEPSSALVGLLVAGGLMRRRRN